MHVSWHSSTKAPAPLSLYTRISCTRSALTYQQQTQNAKQRRRLQHKLEQAITLRRLKTKLHQTPSHHHNTRLRLCNMALSAPMLVPSEPLLHLAPATTHIPFRYTAHAVLDTTTGADIPYSQLIKGPDAPHWLRATSMECGRLAQGLRDGLAGTDTMFFIPHTQKPAHKIATYLRIVAAYKPHKEDPFRIRFTAGGDKIEYAGNVSTPTVDMPTVKCHLNDVISTPNARYCTADAVNFYLGTPLPDYEYMRIPVSVIPADIMDQYNLAPLVHNAYIMVEIRKGIYGLPQAGILANQRLVANLAPHGYYPAPHTPGLFLHHTRPISFTLCVDDFGVKYIHRADAEHLFAIIQEHYTLTIDWTGSLYLGITLHWDYDNRTVDLSMPGYISKALARFQHPTPKRPQHSPHSWTPPTYGAAIQYADDPDTSEPLAPSGLKLLQQIIGTLLYYARAIDNTMLVAISSLALALKTGTQATMDAATHLLNYCATHPDATIRFHASDMVLHVHSDASYLSAPAARSRIGGYFFLSSSVGATPPSPTAPPVPFNGPVLVTCSILRSVVSSAAEAELGALFYNAKEGCMLRSTLQDLGHPQPATPIQTDNSCAAGIANDTVKQKRSKAMDMRFYWVRDRVRQGEFLIYWRRGADNDADYFTKHHPPAEHRRKRSRYLHVPPSSSSTTVCPLQGCVDTTSGTSPSGVVSSSSSPYILQSSPPGLLGASSPISPFTQTHSHNPLQS
jgi:hypothetical protein